MFGIDSKIIDDFKRVEKAAKRVEFRTIEHASARIRKTEIESIDRSNEQSSPGTPPHTRRGQLPRAIRYAVENAEGFIGPVASIVGDSAAAAEFGGEFRGQDYPERPFALPALEQNLDRFASDWQGQIGN